MDPKLLDLMNRLRDETGSATPLTDAELAELRDGLYATMRGVNPQGVSDEEIEVLSDASAYLEVVNAELEVRDGAASERSARAAELLSVLPADPEAPAADAETDTAVDAEVIPAAEVEVIDPAAELEPVAAAANPPARQLPALGRLRALQPKASRPVPTQTDTHRRGAVLTAAADIPNLPAGGQVSLEEFAHGAMRRYEATRKIRSDGANGEKVYFGKIEVEYPEDRWLDNNEHANEEKIRRVTDFHDPEVLAASGGICGPVAVDYSVTTLAVADRPLKGALAQFGATRGGLRYILPHTLAAVTTDAPAAVWTQANDANPSSPTTKPHATFVCQAVQETYVDAVTSIVQFGNFAARYFPEQIQQYMDTVDAVHSRLAESTLLAAMTTASTNVTAANYELGAAREMLSILDRLVARMRYTHRTGPAYPFRFVVPAWLYDMIRADLTKELPGDSGSGIERLATDSGSIDRFFAARNVNVTQVLDSPSGASVLQGWPAQAAGDSLAWPAHTYTWLYPEGTFLYLDGGELNLGMVRDSTLNATNNFQMFSESFEKVAFKGHEALMIDWKIDPTGASVGTVIPSSSTGLTDETLGS